MNGSLRATMLDVFARATQPLTANEAARLAGFDVLSGCSAVYSLEKAGNLRRTNERKPFRFEHASAHERRVLSAALLERPPAGALTPFGLICGGAPA